MLMTPEQIGDLLGLSGDEVAEIKNPWTEVGIVYRQVLAEKTLELHEKTLKLADVGSPTAIEKANEWLQSALISIE